MSFSDHDEEKREDCDSWDFVFGCSGDFEIWNATKVIVGGFLVYQLYKFLKNRN